MLPLAIIICKCDIRFNSCADDRQLYVSAKPDDRHQINKVEERVKDSRHWILMIVLLHHSDKTEVHVLGPQAARSKISDYVTHDGLSVTSQR